MQEIKSKNFVIHDEFIIDFMRRNMVKHIRFMAASDINDACIVTKFPDYENELVLGKHWMNVNYGQRKVHVRNPFIFKPYIGKNVNIYKEKVFAEEFELFRIKPVDFNIHDIYPFKKRKLEMNDPYFSKGYCVLPKNYINRKSGVEIINSYLSFGRTDLHTIESGYIFGRIMFSKELGNLTYSLTSCTNGMRARISRLNKMTESMGKDIMKYRYKDTIFDKNFGYDVIVFEEVKDGD